MGLGTPCWCMALATAPTIIKAATALVLRDEVNTALVTATAAPQLRIDSRYTPNPPSPHTHGAFCTQTRRATNHSP